MTLYEVGLKLRNHRCFGAKWEGFEQLLPINIIIGRNNSGKSSMLDVVERAIYFANPPKGHIDTLKPTPPPHEILYNKSSIYPIDLLVDRNNPRGNLNYNCEINTLEMLPQEGWRVLLGKSVTWQPRTNVIKQDKSGVNIESCHEPIILSSEDPCGVSLLHTINDENDRYAKGLKNPLHGNCFRRVASERDITPEHDSAEFTVTPNGIGTTNIIQRFLQDDGLRHQRVTNELLPALNEIMLTDEVFTEITAQRLRSGDQKVTWEIYLTSQTNENRRIALSESGSGLKTILIVLVNLFLIPHVEEKDLNTYFFGFEELENNLHPALQRRLFTFLRAFAAEHGCHFFFTTHSPVVIDLFSDDEDAQLLHVKRDVETGLASVTTVDTYRDSCHILDDLEARASDLLQANGIVWVEGPSDRIYFNKWITEWTKDSEGGALQDGVHYQCLTYGGSLGTHFTAEEPDFTPDPERVEALINLLKINRNLIFIADSDKRDSDDEPKEHVLRIQEELRKQGIDGISVWITAGKEVENYIPIKAVPLALDDNKLEGTVEDRRYENNVKAIRKFKNKKSLKKVALANDIAKELTKEMLKNTLDLEERLEEACEEIRKWNGLP